MSAIALVFVGRAGASLSAPFGPSHDGFNAALYMTGGRAIVEEGPMASRFGASARTVSGERIVYAHHPPLVYIGDAALAAVLGPTETAARLLAVIAALLVLAQLGVVLDESGLSSGSAAIGMIVAFATPMYFLFGSTTEPHIVGLAPMTSLTLLWSRIRRGRPVAAWLLTLAAVIATLTSWSAALFSVVLGSVLLFFERRRQQALAVLGGTAFASVLAGLWILWAYDGDPTDFWNRAVLRLGVGPEYQITLRQAVGQQRLYFRDLFPLGGWLMVPVAAVGLLDRRTRPFVAVSLGTVLGYAALFKNGAYDHNYWLYCILLPVSFGAAAAAENALRLWASMRRARFVPYVVAGGLVVLVIALLWMPSHEQRQRVFASGIGAQARELRWPAGQRYAYHTFGGAGRTDLLPWLEFYSRRVPFGVEGPSAVPKDEFLVRFLDGRLVTVRGERGLTP